MLNGAEFYKEGLNRLRSDGQRKNEQRLHKLWRCHGDFTHAELVATNFQRAAIIRSAALVARMLAMLSSDSHRFQTAMLRQRQPSDGENQAERLEKAIHLGEATDV